MKLPVRFLLALGLVVNVSGSPAQELVPWSFEPLQRPAIDPASHAGWARDDLDRLIADALDEAGLKPNADADRATLLRRAAFDLTGLPPTPEELDRFLGDPAPTPEAFAKVVDGYLASPRFGERWGRHWLDVARYADSVGRTWNAPFPYAGNTATGSSPPSTPTNPTIASSPNRSRETSCRRTRSNSGGIRSPAPAFSRSVR